MSVQDKYKNDVNDFRVIDKSDSHGRVSGRQQPAAGRNSTTT